MALMDGTTFPAQCPKCGHTVEKEAAWLKANQPFPCAECGGPVKVEGIEEVATLFEELNKSGSSSDVTIGGKRK